MKDCSRCVQYTECVFLDEFLSVWRSYRKEDYVSDGCYLATICNKYKEKPITAGDNVEG